MQVTQYNKFKFQIHALCSLQSTCPLPTSPENANPRHNQSPNRNPNSYSNPVLTLTSSKELSRGRVDCCHITPVLYYYSQFEWSVAIYAVTTKTDGQRNSTKATSNCLPLAEGRWVPPSNTMFPPHSAIFAQHTWVTRLTGAGSQSQ